MTRESDPDPDRSYTGAIEVRHADGHVLGLLHVTIADLDAPVWSAESSEPVNLTDVDPSGETVTAQLADAAHPRAGERATAHLEVRAGRTRLAGNYGFHAAGH